MNKNLKTKVIAFGIITIFTIGGSYKVTNACQYNSFPPAEEYKLITANNTLPATYTTMSSMPMMEYLINTEGRTASYCNDANIFNNNVPNVEESSMVEEQKEEIDIWNLPIEIDENDVKLLANVMYGEARGIKSDKEKAAVAWCILNRVDSTMNDFKKVNTIYAVITQKHQFDGYGYNNPHTDELMELARDILYRWNLEKMGYEDVGRVLPKDYYWFLGDGKHNYFTNIWCKGSISKAKKNAYTWELGSPYEEK